MRPFACLALLVSLTLAASCGSDGAARSDTDDRQGTVREPVAADEVPAGSGPTWEDGEPVQGNVLVAWKNLDPAYQSAAVGLVNESSEIGQKLKSGKSTSSEIRVLSDREMGGLLQQLAQLGFFKYATEGLSLDTIPERTGKKGIVVVTQDGRAQGLLLTLNLGTSPVPKAYADSKKIILFAHSQVQGFDVKVGAGEADERIFSAPPPRLKRP